MTATKALTVDTIGIGFLRGTFVILTHGEVMSLLCSGDPEVRLTLPITCTLLISVTLMFGITIMDMFPCLW